MRKRSLWAIGIMVFMVTLVSFSAFAIPLCEGDFDKCADLDGSDLAEFAISDPIPEAPIIDFFALPELTQTNILTFVVASSTEPDNEVRLNGTPLPPDAMDEEGNFAVPAPLVEGDNRFELVIKSGEEVITTAEKTVHFNEGFSTGGKRLIYVDSVARVPALLGTIVVDLDSDTLLGLIEDKHVVGISPDGSEIYTSDRTVISTDTHRELRTLPFTPLYFPAITTTLSPFLILIFFVLCFLLLFLNIVTSKGLPVPERRSS